MDRSAAWNTVCEFVQAPGLRRHMLAVEAAMKSYADLLGENMDDWALAGLLHDYDWEIHPTLQQHPAAGAALLDERGCPSCVIRAILSHNPAGTGVDREAPIDYALLACDELTGLVTAVTLVRPSRSIADVRLKSIRRRWKDRSFAAGVNRQEVEAATADFSRECFHGNLDLWDHVRHVLTAMQNHAAAIELDGRLA